MSSPDGFKRCNGFAGSIPQNFINANMPVCPMCGSADPYWTHKDKLEFTAHRILFRCKDCGCVISATQDDFSGTTKSTAYAVLKTGGAVNALVKKKQGKDVKTVYMKVEDAGSAQTSSAFVGKELPIDEFKAMAAAFGAPAAPAAEEAPAPEAAPVEATEPEIKVTYAAPAAPQAEPEVKVSYAAPAPAPVAPAPKAKKAKAPVASIIFTVFAMLGVFCTIGIDIVPLFLPHFGLPGGIAYTAKIGLTTVLGSIQLLGMLLFLIVSSSTAKRAISSAESALPSMFSPLSQILSPVMHF